MNYIIDRLPEGYALFDRPRLSNPEVVSLIMKSLLLVQLLY